MATIKSARAYNTTKNDIITEENSEYINFYLPKIYKNPKELKDATKRYLDTTRGHRPYFQNIYE